MKVVVLSLVVPLYFFQPAVAGKIYTWTDGEGNVHIEGKPPADDSVVENVIHFQEPPAKGSRQPGTIENAPSASDQRAADLVKKLKRLNQKKDQIEAIVEENKAAIRAAEQDAGVYRKRNSARSRRNKKMYERQLLVLRNNLMTYESRLQYLNEDIAETEQSIKRLEMNIESETRKP
jgi:predicted RNase H-like nuclease (RuvC/YqgF family)